MAADVAQKVQPMVNSQRLVDTSQIQRFLAQEGYATFVAEEGMVAQNLSRLLGQGGNVLS